MKMRDKKTGIIVEFNPEAFAERGQDFNSHIETMKKEGFEIVQEANKMEYFKIEMEDYIKLIEARTELELMKKNMHKSYTVHKNIYLNKRED